MMTNCKSTSIVIILIMIFNEYEANQWAQDLVTIHSSCNGIDKNGLYYIKPLPDKAILPVICNNGWTMIDGSLDDDLKVLPSFLNSWDYGKSDAYEYVRTFSRLDDLSTWREWWLPANQHTKFRIAPSCDQCIDGEYEDNTVYYTDSYTYCASNLKTNGCIDDITSDEYRSESCHTCDSAESFDDDGNWLICAALRMRSDHPINHNHKQCVSHGLTFHPSISHSRDACTCYQPQELGNMGIQVPDAALPVVSWTVTDPDDISEIYEKYDLDPDTFYIDPHIKFSVVDTGIKDLRESNIVELYQTDFDHGTYRITQSGTYRIMEDIVFNFQSPTPKEMADEFFSPNGIDGDHLYWFPSEQQGLGDNAYPGLYRYEGPYALGFFAGITIETDWVSIELNGFTLSQHPTFYLQQRFFSLIELSSMPFIPGQGPGNWGSKITSGNHIEITNGNLGLTSHHAIHGNKNNNITIANVSAFNFDVAGIQCNACKMLLISDVVIGPQNQNIPVLGRYTHARALLPRMKQLANQNGDAGIRFYGRQPTTVNALIDRLINQMDMIYFHIINGVEYDEDDEEWIAAKKLFYNPSGWMDGGTSYGLVLGGVGAQVVGIGTRIKGTTDIILRNIEIYGIGNKLIEKIKFSDQNGATKLMFFDAIDWIAVTDQVDDPTISRYIGDAYTDCVFAANRYIDSWYYLNSLYITPAEESYVFEGDSNAFTTHILSIGNDEIGGCGADIQLHSSKGAIGLRIDGVRRITIDNIYIHDIANWADLGNQEWCGQYEHLSVGGEDGEIQYGFSGTRSHGMIIDYVEGALSNIRIEGVESYHGEANGLTIYKECNVTLENIQVNKIYAGTKLTDDDIVTLDLPNLTPRACGVDIRDNTIVTIVDDNAIIKGDEIMGFETCYDDEIETEQIKDVFLLNAMSSDNKWNKNYYLITLICLIIIIGFIYSKTILITRKKIDNYEDKKIKISEFTPLII